MGQFFKGFILGVAVTYGIYFWGDDIVNTKDYFDSWRDDAVEDTKQYN